MRYFEWLFPIMRYVRLRREVSGVVVAAWWLIGVLLITLANAVPIGIAYAKYPTVAFATPSGALLPAIPSRNLGPVDAVRVFVAEEWPLLLIAAVVASVVLIVLDLPEFLLALLFVRKRPGRRRPKCTWQTLKYVMVGNVTLALCFVMLMAGTLSVQECSQGGLIGRAVHTLPVQSQESVWISLGIIGFVALPLILLGAVSAQAASAVVVLQDDRRCEQCGYFLIHLTSPRCPECGRPFDPAKMGKLSLASTGAAGNPENPNDLGDSGG